MENSKYSLIIAVTNRGYTDVVMDAAKNEGARGGTYIHARGTSSLEAQKFLGINIEPEKDLILIIAENDIKTKIMKAINEQAGLDQQGKGIVFALPVDDVMGSFFNQ